MDGRRYDREMWQGRCYELEPLFSGSSVERLLQVSAGSVRRVEMAARAWERVVEQPLLRGTKVEAFEAGTLRVLVREATVRQELRSRHDALRRQLAELLPGLRQVQFLYGTTE